jgi:hypothetical protein
VVTALDGLSGARDPLARARVHSANFHAYHASRPVPPQPRGTPRDSPPPQPREPSRAALALAAARAANARLQAAAARR